MKLSIVIPCYNEDESICKLLNLLLKQQYPIDHEIIIIDDAFTHSCNNIYQEILG